jgi:DNA-directed RNA polymerase specialized sigma24 family protein
MYFAPPPQQMPRMASLCGDSMKAEAPTSTDHPASTLGAGAENGVGLLVERPEIQDALRRLVQARCNDPDLQEDIVQEVQLCLWRAEVTTPGKTLSWYLERCRFCIQHFFKKGRSVDSLKRSDSACSLNEFDELELPAAGDLWEEICARDEREQLAWRLDPQEQQTLQLRWEELSEREIAQQEHVRPATVIDRCRHIRTIALGLGIRPRNAA